MKKKHYRHLLKQAEQRRKNAEQRNINLTSEIARMRTEHIGVSTRLLLATREQELMADLKPQLMEMFSAMREYWGIKHVRYAIYEFSEESDSPAEKEIAKRWIEILSLLDWEDR